MNKEVIQYDLLVIGCGAAGFYAARRGGRLGLKTAVVEKSNLGGTAFYWGSLPVKMIADKIKNYQKAAASLKGVSFNGLKEDFLLSENDFKQIEEKIKRDLKEAGVDLFLGEGEFISAKKFQINNKEIKADNIIIATGTELDNTALDLKIDQEQIITHKEAVQLKQLPQDILIVGANIEGAEFASIFSFLGLKVYLVEKEAKLLPDIDEDLSSVLKKKLKKDGVEINCSTTIENVEKIETEAGIKVKLKIKKKDSKENKVKTETITVDKLLITGSRKINLPKAFKKTGVKLGENKIIVDKKLETNIKGIYAAGDVNGRYGIASTAINDALFILEEINKSYLKNSNKKEEKKSARFSNFKTADQQQIPLNIFSMPEIAGIGLSETDLKKRKIDYKVEKYYFKDSWRTLNQAAENSFIKILYSPQNEKIFGIYLIGNDLSEIISSLSLAADNLNMKNIMENIYVHPTRTEILQETVLKSFLN